MLSSFLSDRAYLNSRHCSLSLLSLRRPRRAIAPFQGYPQSRPPQTLGTRTNFPSQISVPRVFLATRPFSFKSKRVLPLALLSSAPSISNLPSHWSPITSPPYVNHYPRKFPDSTNSPITVTALPSGATRISHLRVMTYTEQEFSNYAIKLHYAN